MSATQDASGDQSRFEDAHSPIGGPDPSMVLAAEDLATQGDSAFTATQTPPESLWPLIRGVSPDQFGIQRPTAEAGTALSPYVARDVDAQLDEALRSDAPVILVVAAPQSGAIRSVYEALLRTRPDDRMLNANFVGLDPDANETGGLHPEAFLSSDVDLVWILNLGELVRRSPSLADLLRTRRHEIAATIVAVVREDDVELISQLELSGARTIELGRFLSDDERQRAGRLYRGERINTVSDVATATPRYLGQRRARYAADSFDSTGLVSGDDDILDIRADVDMLAALIASNQVLPPLSIGLFGQWGSGKSFLMHQIKLKISDLAGRSREAGSDSPNVFCSEIVPIEFNAWQYADGNLWASLINRVFEGIQEHLGGDERYQKALAGIERQNKEVADAQRDLDRAKGEVERTQAAATDRKVTDVAGTDEALKDSAATLKSTIDLDPELTQLSELRDEVVQLRTISGRLRKGWSGSSGRRRTLVLLAGFLGAVLLALVTIVPAVARAGTALLGIIVPLTATVIGVLKPANRALAAGAKLLGANDVERREYDEARQRHENAAGKLGELKHQGLAGLYGFVVDRHTAVDYRQHLGMAPIIREDLKRLAVMAEKKPDAPGIDRVVIFIDDLDRCDVDQVVRVLEAVNLLFGFKLFVVVVAVDSRWLIRSLQSQFKDVFDSDDGLAPSPRNYLEKIIQIPFWLRPMQPTGFGRLVTTLVGELETDSRKQSPAGAATATSDGTANAGEPFHTPPGPIPNDAATQPTLSPAQQTVETARQDVVDLNPAALKLTTDELEFVRRLAPLVCTPRAAKRLVNTYQLLRVTASDVESFISDREYEPVLILLALMTGTADLDDEMAATMRDLNAPNLGKFLEQKNPKWADIAAACSDLPTNRVTSELLAEWLQRVARYSFHPTAL